MLIDSQSNEGGACTPWKDVASADEAAAGMSFCTSPTVPEESKQHPFGTEGAGETECQQHEPSESKVERGLLEIIEAKGSRKSPAKTAAKPLQAPAKRLLGLSRSLLKKSVVLPRFDEGGAATPETTAPSRCDDREQKPSHMPAVPSPCVQDKPLPCTSAEQASRTSTLCDEREQEQEDSADSLIPSTGSVPMLATPADTKKCGKGKDTKEKGAKEKVPEKDQSKKHRKPVIVFSGFNERELYHPAAAPFDPLSHSRRSPRLLPSTPTLHTRSFRRSPFDHFSFAFLTSSSHCHWGNCPAARLQITSFARRSH